MTVVEKMARAMCRVSVAQRLWTRSGASVPDDTLQRYVDRDWHKHVARARAAIEALHDSFADPVVRAAIQAALDEKEG